MIGTKNRGKLVEIQSILSGLDLDLMPLPFPLRHKRVLGYARLIAGERSPGRG